MGVAQVSVFAGFRLLGRANANEPYVRCTSIGDAELTSQEIKRRVCRFRESPCANLPGTSARSHLLTIYNVGIPLLKTRAPGSRTRRMKHGGLDRVQFVEPVVEHLFEPLQVAQQ